MAGETKVLTVGQAASALDIFLSANGAAVSGQYVGFELFDASNTSAVSGVALNPSLGKYVGSGTIPAGFQLGTWRVDWTIITLNNGLVNATEPFCVQDLNVTVGFVPLGDKHSDIYEAVRLDIGDPDGQVFNDDFLKRNLKKAVRRLNHRLGLSATNRPKGIPGNFGGPRIKVSPIVADLEAGTITPNNDEICDLVVMQIELIILESEVSALKRLAATASSGPYASIVGSASQDGISVKNADGVQVTIAPSRLTTRADLHKFDVKNRRDELERMIRAFLNRQTGNYGKMIY
jgi:hypothetical protein